MIELNNISFHYPDSNEILENVSLKIDKGSCVAIAGQSGCGKSTLLNLIAGTLKPTKGCISIETGDISYLMQDVTLMPYLNVLENVILAYTLRNKVVDKKVMVDADKLLQLFQIGKDEYKKYPHELSGGMRQKIALVQTLLTSPELLLLDEPFTGIDVLSLSDIENKVYNSVKEKGITMVYITHNIEQAILLSDRIVIIKDNSISGDLSLPDDFIKESPLKRSNKGELCKRIFSEIIQNM